MASRASCSTARPFPRSSRTSCRSTRSACCTRRPPRSTRRARWSRPMRGCSRASGGEIRQSDIKAIAPEGEGWRVVLADGEMSARHVVVALGPWSPDLLRPLGYRVPHGLRARLPSGVQAEPGTPLQRPIHDAEGSFLMTPMEQGIRVTSRRRADRARCALVVRPARRGGAARARRGRIRRGRRRTLARGAADACPTACR